MTIDSTKEPQPLKPYPALCILIREFASIPEEAGVTGDVEAIRYMENYEPGYLVCLQQIADEIIQSTARKDTRAAPVEPQPAMEMVEILALSDKCVMIGSECVIRVDDAVEIIQRELLSVREKAYKIKSHSLATNNLLDRREEIGRLNNEILAALDKMFNVTKG